MPRNLKEIIAENLKHLMDLHSDGVTEFAKKVEVDQPTVSRLLNMSSKNPTVSTLESITRPLKVSVAWLLTDHRNPEIPEPTLADIMAEVKKGHVAESEMEMLVLWRKLTDDGQVRIKEEIEADAILDPKSPEPSPQGLTPPVAQETPKLPQKRRRSSDP